jgi:hypothetical protein
MGVPRLTRRFGNERLLAFGLSTCIVGLLWMARLTYLSPYATGIALPMILIGIGQGLVLAPLTVAAVKGVASDDAGAASWPIKRPLKKGGDAEHQPQSNAASEPHYVI